MKFTIRLSIYSLIATFTFAHHASANTTTIHFHSPEAGSIENLATQSKTPVVKDAEISIKIDSPTMLKLDGRIPVMIVPAQSGDSNVKLNPPLEKEVVERASQKDIGNSVSEIMMQMETVHKSIQKKNFNQASAEIDELQARFPQVGFLGFARGSIYLLQGEKNKAREAVSRALQAYPNYKEGQDFLKALGGNDKAGGKNE